MGAHDAPEYAPSCLVFYEDRQLVQERVVRGVKGGQSNSAGEFFARQLLDAWDRQPTAFETLAN